MATPGMTFGQSRLACHFRVIAQEKGANESSWVPGGYQHKAPDQLGSGRIAQNVTTHLPIALGREDSNLQLPD